MIIFLILLLVCVLPVEARTPRTIRISDDYSSVTVNEDSTLSFCYCGPGRRVSVQSDLLYADEDSNRYTDHTAMAVFMSQRVPSARRPIPIVFG